MISFRNLLIIVYCIVLTSSCKLEVPPDKLCSIPTISIVVSNTSSTTHTFTAMNIANDTKIKWYFIDDRGIYTINYVENKLTIFNLKTGIYRYRAIVKNTCLEDVSIDFSITVK